MGNLEINHKKKAKREHLQKIVLASIKAVGLLSVGLLAPNVIKAMDQVGLLPRTREREYISSSASKLRKRGFIKFEDGYYKLTHSGEQLMRKWELSDYKLFKPKKWDKKWRLVIFDIPEKKKKIRKQICALFNQAGLYRLQDSVWVYPYDCEDIIGLLKTDFGVGKDVLYIIADEIENDRHLRQEFNLH